jgi:hypothetical protein
LFSPVAYFFAATLALSVTVMAIGFRWAAGVRRSTGPNDYVVFEFSRWVKRASEAWVALAAALFVAILIVGITIMFLNS